MPADTPAQVTIRRPRRTIRSSPTGVTPNAFSADSAAQCDVARLPSSSPAAARITEPGAHRRRPRRGLVRRPHPVEQLLVAGMLDRGEAAGHQNDVGRRCFVERVRGADDEHAGVGGDRSGLVPDEPDLGVGQPAQHFVGSDEVQCGEARVQHDGDLHDSSSVGEGLAVLVGRDADSANEVAPHGFCGAEPAPRGDHGDGVVGFLELPARGLGAHALDVGAGRLADLVGEHPGEVPRAHRRAPGELGHAVRGRRVRPRWPPAPRGSARVWRAASTPVRRTASGRRACAGRAPASGRRSARPRCRSRPRPATAPGRCPR